MKTICRSLQLIGVGSALLAGQALASGYNFGTQSASNQGFANAGAAGLTDASVLFYNPAGMSQVEGTQVSGVLNYIIPDGNFTNTNSTNAAGMAVTGSNGGSFGVATPVPHMYLTHQIDDRWTVGVGMFVPFGSHTDYSKDWVGRYNTTESSLMTFNLNPSVAYKFNDMVTVGAGVSVQYIEGKLAKQLDLGLSAASTACKSVPAATCSALMRALASKTQYDGSSEVTGDDIGYGFNLGATFKLSDATRVGVAYRSAIKHKLEGDAKFTVPQNFASSALGAAAGGQIQAGLNAQLKNKAATLEVETPESFSLNAFHQINEQWAVMADYTWTRHSRFDEIRIKLDGAADSVTPTNWNDTSRYSVGVSYKPTEKWTLRGGLAYDNAPENDQNRIASIPDSDRVWVALGANYAFTPTQSVDLTAIYVDLKNSTIAQKDQNGATVRGNYDISSVTLGVQYNHRF
ncbi:OmpP1/FadL family transporter [Chitinibacter sp. ZOR0017]|uniref:OmpP1/FadL family transporter n=1 Tax=Chitinibacter sp. ZOR0017 TaxID=1339254 RepID=UPI0006460021|nr:OmpP1/FadL family transporter [Chitinibacter sp. ZOR0017]